MSKVLGIIAEYNPFHNGHLHHLNESKKITGATYTVAIMDGNFTQRGNTSIMDKWSKAKSALECGIDLVIELPVLYAISSAENFADGAIKILNSMNIVDYISFGAETSDISILDNIANILYEEPENYKNFLSSELQTGLSFPKSRENALLKYLNNNKFANVLSSPNNILGIEYLKALKKYKSEIQPIVIPRFEANHNDIDYQENIASGTAIRILLKNKEFDTIKNLIPSPVFSNLIENIDIGHIVPDLYVFEREVILNLRRMSTYEISLLPDVSEGLEFSIKKAANSCNSIAEFLNMINSKRYTSTRLQRILLYSLLGITKKDMNISKVTNPYIRVLGFNEHGKNLVSEISKSNPKLNIITSVKNFTDKNLDKNLKIMLEKDIWATDVYTMGYEHNSCSNLDFTHKLITI